MESKSLKRCGYVIGAFSLAWVVACGPSDRDSASDADAEAELRESSPGYYILNHTILRASRLLSVELRPDGTAREFLDRCGTTTLGDFEEYEWAVTGPDTVEFRLGPNPSQGTPGTVIYTFEVAADPCGPHQYARPADDRTRVAVKGRYCLENPSGGSGDEICDLVPCDTDAQACIDRIGPITNGGE